MCQYLEKCTGSFQEEGKRPAPNTKCVGPCIQDAGRWGKSYCYTNKEESQWGAECVNCQGTNNSLEISCVITASKKFQKKRIVSFHMSIFRDDQRVRAAKVSFLCLKLGNVVRARTHVPVKMVVPVAVADQRRLVHVYLAMKLHSKSL